MPKGITKLGRGVLKRGILKAVKSLRGATVQQIAQNVSDNDVETEDSTLITSISNLVADKMLSTDIHYICPACGSRKTLYHITENGLRWLVENPEPTK